MPELMDLIGQTFNDLTVIERAPSQKKQTMWLCQCACGNLRHGTVKSCGCKQFTVLADKFTKNEVGKRFGRLTVFEMIKRPEIKNGKKNGNKIYFRCLCDCGNETIVWGAHLRNGSIVSCGCYMREATGNANRTHGLSHTKEYATGRRHLRHELDSEWTLDMEQLLRSMFNSCCICGITEEEHLENYGQSLHIDHVMPLSKGHGLSPSNAVLMCRHCNDVKKNKSINDLPIDWQAKLIYNVFKFKDAWDVMTFEDI